jgi:tight adherence protein B
MDPFVALVGFLVFGSVASSAWFVTNRVTAEREVTRRRAGVDARALDEMPLSVLRDTGARLPFVDRLPLSREARARMELELEQAGQPIRVNEYLALRIACALVLSLVALFVLSRFGAPSWLVAIVSLAATVPGWALPRIFVSRQRQQRQRRFEKQLPDALTAIAKSLRAGTGLLQALAYSADETPAPLGTELQSALRDLQLGADPDIVFNTLSQRVGGADIDIAVTAILIQRNVGGNLSEILSNVTNTIRERAKLQGEIMVLTSRQRLTGNLVALLPVVVAALFILVNPKMGRLLIETTAGRISLAIGLGFELFGIWLIRRLSVIEV